ncbi:hypothetical protein BC828DRAFT_373575 [Blastocladiella britannica]|nr:hypothetical protein BC828DRAFT_373575 [Blastocladiella britannica]
MPPPQPDKSRDPRFYTPEYVRELRKERDLYARTLLNSAAGPPQLGGATSATGQITASGSGLIGPGAVPGLPGAEPGWGNRMAGSMSRTPAVNGSRVSVATSQSQLNTGPSNPHLVGATGGEPRQQPSGGRQASVLASVSGGGLLGGSSHQGSSLSLNGTRHAHPVSSQQLPIVGSHSLSTGGGGGGGMTAAASRRRASVISFNSTIPRGTAPLAGDQRGSQFGRIPGPRNSAVNASYRGHLSQPPASAVHESGRHVAGLTSSSSMQKFARSGSASKVGTMEDAVFEPIMGDVAFQMNFHYLWYGVLLFIGYAVGWISQTRPVGISIYFATCFCVAQVSRAVYATNDHSLLPMYLSILPFIEFCLLARESHILFSVLWFISLMVISMQSGASQLTRHIMFSSALQLLAYLISVGLMTNGSAINIFNRYNSMFVRELTPVSISIPAEGTFLVFMALLQMGLFMLQRFIKRYAYFLIERQRRMTKLQVANQELQDKLKSLKVGDQPLDLDSPITKVIQIIKGIQTKERMDGEVVESLDYVIGILSSNKLFQVDLGAFKENIDQDVKQWLDNMLQAKETNASPELNTGNTVGGIVGTAATPALTDGLRPGVEGLATPGLIAGGGNGLSSAIPEIIYKPVLANDTLIQAALSSAETWDFNCFELAQVTNGRPLYFFAQHCFAHFDMHSMFGLDRSKVERFFISLESGYRANPYHNSIHAVDVMHGAYYFLTTLGMADLLSVEERLACLLAAACHDVDHPGVTNAFLVETRSDLAVRYNDQSVLENHHTAKAFELLLNNPECNFLSALSKESQQHLRQCMIKMVLATDMAFHFELHSRFKNKLSGAGINLKDVKDRQLIMEISIKCADVSNPTRPPELSKKWTELVMREFYQQGDIERSLGIPISRFMDREQPGVGKCQLGFIEFVVAPLYETWDSYMNEEHVFPGLEHLQSNRDFWKSYQDPPPSVPLVLSGIKTPEYLLATLGKPTVVTPFAHTFKGLSSMCQVQLPTMCTKLADPLSPDAVAGIDDEGATGGPVAVAAAAARAGKTPSGTARP